MGKKSYVCDKTFNNADERDFHDSLHIPNTSSETFGYKTDNGRCVMGTK